MVHHLKNVLTAFHLNKIRELLAKSRFVDGKLSAGSMARDVKQNLELHPEDVQVQELNRLVMEQLLSHGMYQRCAFALRVAAPLFIKYATGMHYGEHVDNPVMGQAGGLYRCDLAASVFLNDDYRGGELIISTTFAEQRVKLPAGDAVIYPASSRHRVEPVSDGERLVAVTWIQSMIQSQEHRDALTRLSRVRDDLLQANATAHANEIDQVYVNLVRMWAQL